MSLNLIDIDTKEVICLNLGSLNTIPYNPRFVFTYEPTNVNSDHSVQFFQDGTFARTENVHPYVLSGDISGNYFVWKNIPKDRDFTVSIKEFSSKNGIGAIVKELSTKIHFTTRQKQVKVYLQIQDNKVQLTDEVTIALIVKTNDTPTPVEPKVYLAIGDNKAQIEEQVSIEIQVR